MASGANFTAERIARFKCAKGKQQSIFWDGKTPGLGLRVTAAGAKSYIFETRLHGKTLRTTIGDARTWSIGKAQKEATRLKTLTDQRIDPRQQAAEQEAEAEAKRQDARRREVTVGQAWDVYLAARTPKWGARHLLNHKNLAKVGGEWRKRGRKTGEPETVQPGPLFRLLSLPLAGLDAKAVKAWLEREAERGPTQAAQAYRALRAFVAWCAEHDDYRNIAVSGACNPKLARDVLPKPRAKSDCLEREQLAAWFANVCALPNPVISAYLQALLLTGARREEMASLRWADVDFQWHSLTIHDKVEGSRVIPLPLYLESLLLNLKRMNETPPKVRKLKEDNPAKPWKPSKWVFFSKTAADGKIAEPRIAHTKALQAGGLPHISLHGLRRSFGTLSEWVVEVPVGVVAQIMGHKPSAIAEKHYRVRPLSLLRQWHDKIEASLLEQAGVPFVRPTEAPALRAVNSA